MATPWAPILNPDGRLCLRPNGALTVANEQGQASCVCGPTEPTPCGVNAGFCICTGNPGCVGYSPYTAGGYEYTRTNSGPRLRRIMWERPISCCCKLTSIFQKIRGISRRWTPGCGSTPVTVGTSQADMVSPSGTVYVSETFTSGCTPQAPVLRQYGWVAALCSPLSIYAFTHPGTDPYQLASFFNNDNWTDLYAVEYVDCTTHEFHGQAWHRDFPGLFLQIDVVHRTGFSVADCVALPCPRGACCCGDRCYDQISRAECDAWRGLYKGDESRCVSVVCPTPRREGACCLPDGTCRPWSSRLCAEAFGIYRGDYTTCPNANCPPAPIWACCLPDGTCTPATYAACQVQGGGWNPGSYCGQVNCSPQSTGACCIPDGSCLQCTEAECIAQTGIWHGTNTDCQTATCSGACCHSTSQGWDCNVEGYFTCANSLGTFAGFGTTCNPWPCPGNQSMIGGGGMLEGIPYYHGARGRIANPWQRRGCGGCSNQVLHLPSPAEVRAVMRSRNQA